MKAQQLRPIAQTLTATVSDRRKVTALVKGINLAITEATIASLKAIKTAYKLAQSFNADNAFLSLLASKIKELKAQIKPATVAVKFEAFKIPYTFVKGIATYKGESLPFICYFNAPSLANPARAIDPTFGAVQLEPSLKAKLRDSVRTALVQAWDAYRVAVTGQQLAV